MTLMLLFSELNSRLTETNSMLGCPCLKHGHQFSQEWVRRPTVHLVITRFGTPDQQREASPLRDACVPKCGRTLERIFQCSAGLLPLSLYVDRCWLLLAVPLLVLVQISYTISNILGSQLCVA